MKIIAKKISKNVTFTDVFKCVNNIQLEVNNFTIESYSKMFKNVCQNGLLSIFYSIGANPLAIWDSEVHNGHIKRLTDKDVNSIVLEIISNNVQNTYITCPKNNKSLGIHMPFLVMIVKNLKRYFSFEVTILDDRNFRRRFQISNFNSTTKIKTFSTSMPIGLSGGWNQIQFNLADFTKRAYGTTFIETLRIQIHANTRVRRVYFCDRLYSEEELPPEYKLYLPLDMKKKKNKGKPDAKAATSEISKAGPEVEIIAESKTVDGVGDEPIKKVSELTVAAPSPVTVAEEPVTESIPGEGEPELQGENEEVEGEGVDNEQAAFEGEVLGEGECPDEVEDVVESNTLAEGAEASAEADGPTTDA